MVPIYAISSWLSLVNLKAAQFVEPVRDMYEAFTIYTFFQLLINFLGGERSLIIMMHGRAPKQHVWPMNFLFPKVDISDPHTFLAIKRGILQYAWLKLPLAIAAIAMKATGTYQEGYIGLKSGYFWSGIIYNISVTLSLYSLGIFWVCMSRDLHPFRPVPKVEPRSSSKPAHADVGVVLVHQTHHLCLILARIFPVNSGVATCHRRCWALYPRQHRQSYPGCSDLFRTSGLRHRPLVCVFLEGLRGRDNPCSSAADVLRIPGCIWLPRSHRRFKTDFQGKGISVPPFRPE